MYSTGYFLGAGSGTLSRVGAEGVVVQRTDAQKDVGLDTLARTLLAGFEWGGVGGAGGCDDSSQYLQA